MKILLRQLLFLIIGTLLWTGIQWYYASDLYAGSGTEDITINLLDTVLIVAMIFNIKYLVFEVIATYALRYAKSSATISIFSATYILALIIDVVWVFFGLEPTYMNLGLFATLMYTPIILIVGLTAIFVYRLTHKTLWASR